MIRARFYANLDDPRPVHWPIKHPYWVSGTTDTHSIVVAYADNEREIHRNWPDAERVDAHAVDAHAMDGYTFTDRFPRPSWWEPRP